MRQTIFCCAAFLYLFIFLFHPWPAAAANGYKPSTTVVIASNLDNPRGMAFGPDGALYVAEAGHGGTATCVINGEHQDRFCLGRSGAVSRINVWQHTQQRLLSGLASLAPATYPNAPVGATGPSDVAFDRFGQMHLVIGWSLRPLTLRDQLPIAETMGKIFRVLPWGTLVEEADAFPVEQQRNPDGRNVDANPTSLAIGPQHQLVVADAGANDVIEIHHGQVRRVVVLPARQVQGEKGGTLMESVPSAITQGPDGAFYIAEFTGDPFPTGGAQIWRWFPGHAPQVIARGFTLISDLTYAHGSLYVLEYAQQSLRSGPSSGAVIKMDLRTQQRTVVLNEGLVGPSGMTVGSDGAIYIANGSMTSQGIVLRITEHTHV